MTGTDMLREAIALLNYTNSAGEIDARQSADITRRGLPIINRILADLSRIETGKAVQLAALGDDIPLTPETLYDVMPYGVAMLVAAGERDGDIQQFMAAIYNQKRARVPHASARVRDVLPMPCE